MKASITSLVKTYFGLTKPERTLSNTLTAIAGFLFASQWEIDWLVFLALVAGLSLVIASACVFNNLVDKDIDSLMPRTQNRALPTGKVSVRNSVIYGAILGTAGFLLLVLTNWLTVGVIATAFIFYVVIYGFAKRRTQFSTLIGTVPGGASLVAGYTAVANQLDGTALILFLIMLSWQMVHFYAIAIYRQKDYAAAKIPVISVKEGVSTTKIHMLAYLVIFIFVASLLTWQDFTGYAYLTGVLLLGAVWLYQLLLGFSAKDNARWARGVFKTSLVVLLAMCVLLALGPTLP